MVAVGKQMMAKEEEDKARMREFMTAVRPFPPAPLSDARLSSGACASLSYGSV